MSWQAEIERGYELYRQGEHREVLKRFARLRLEYPDVAQVWNESAGMHDRMGFEEDAAPLYERALALGLEGEELVDCLICLGSTYRNLGRGGDAVRLLGQALLHESKDAKLQGYHRALGVYFGN
ncbi:tetratricopeptide repeat protein [Tumebacillus avium]|nr:tetratricopeptide repeat protein [Tumebacillus avium]